MEVPYESFESIFRRIFWRCPHDLHGFVRLVFWLDHRVTLHWATLGMAYVLSAVLGIH